MTVGRQQMLFDLKDAKSDWALSIGTPNQTEKYRAYQSLLQQCLDRGFINQKGEKT